MAAHEQRLVRARTKSQRALKEECETLELKEVRLREEVQAELCQPQAEAASAAAVAHRRVSAALEGRMRCAG